jgi:hypothetical protein
MKQKNLKKRIARLTARIAKDTKKLAKLQRKLAAAPQPQAAKTKAGGKAKESKQAAKPAKPARKKKRHLSPEGRAKLRALMKARWDAKRAAAAAQGGTGDQGETPGTSSPPAS